MADGENDTGVAGQIQQLRQELKEWEKGFAAENNGSKPGRENIKCNPAIAQKYKEYNRLRGRKSSQPHIVASSSPPFPQKRGFQQLESGNEPPRAKRLAPSHPSAIDPYDLPAQGTPVALRTSIGPTPQKNGQVLGLFDLLSPPSGKPSPSQGITPQRGVMETQSTPAKKQAIEDLHAFAATPSRSLGRTQSSAARNYLEKFLTPTALRFKGKLPISSQKANLDATPEFLRRESQCFPPLRNSAIDEDGNERLEALVFSPIAVRMKSRPVGKGLSALVKGLKDMEDEMLDDELDALREMEAEEAGSVSARVDTALFPSGHNQSMASRELPLGADGEHANSGDEDPTLEEVGLNGKPLKVWKKRGQKRTTRKANIKPSTAKWKPEPAWEPGKENEDLRNEPDRQEKEAGTANQVARDKEGQNKDTTSNASAKGAKKSGKIKASAHANFRALKLRNKASTGSKGGRFTRRR